MSKFPESVTVREFVNALTTCLLPIEIVRVSPQNYETVWKGFKDDIDECDYADHKIFTDLDGKVCGIYLRKIVIWIE